MTGWNGRHRALVGLLTVAVAACGARDGGAAQTPQASQPEVAKQASTELDRTVLPIAMPEPAVVTEIDARKATPPVSHTVHAPAGAPNVVVVLIDDMGFGVPSAFGGGVSMPTLERLADNGLRYNRFHTTALCSPTRMALLTGRNHHTANTGSVMEVATAFYGNQGMRPSSVAPLAETLRQNGYSTAAFGKYHEAPTWEVSASGPFDRWPTHSGFDKFYGFIGGETNQWAPLLYDGVTRVEAPDQANYHFTTDMTNRAIGWMRSQKSLTPDKPFFTYFATGATHAPLHAPKEWIARYKGKFNGGWDRYREETLARQKKLGIVPENTDLAPLPEEIPSWDSLGEDEKRLYARQMEVFAAMASHTDHEIGRMVDALQAMDQLDNTLFVYMAGDNGSSAEGGLEGTFNEMIGLNGLTGTGAETVKSQLAHIDDYGGPKAYNHFAVPWVIATNTPFQWTKQVASHFGGTRNAMVVHWPQGVAARGEMRSQFHHVIDIAPTVLEAAKLPEPKRVNGVDQLPIEGTSMLYSFADGSAEEQHKTQYFEMFGNRAIYHDGWTAVTKHRTPWQTGQVKLPPFEEDKWELYNVNEDFSQAHDLASQHPKKLQELQALWLREATKHHVLPLDDRVGERFNAAIAGRPDLMGDRKSITLYPGMDGLLENTMLNVKNRSHTITAKLEVPANGGGGVVVCQGGRFAGWSLYLDRGRPAYTHNWVGLKRYTVKSNKRLPKGPVTLRYEFKYDGGDPGSGGQGKIFVNDEEVASGRIERTVPFVFSADETTDVGRDDATPVVETYGEGRATHFQGKIEQVTVQLVE